MGRNKKNAIHGYFTYNSNNKTSTCVKCNKVLQGNHSSNLLRHFYTQHRKYHIEITKINQMNTSSQQVNENSTHSKITKCCLDLVTVHGRPFSMLEDDAFQELLKMIPSVKGLSISAKSIKYLITEKSYEIRKTIFHEVENKLISLKADVGSVKTRRFLGLNIQHIEEDKIVLRNLGVVELHESNTGKYLKETILFILSQYGIEIKQIYSITTDNGSNMLSMSRQIEEALEEECQEETESSREEFSFINEADYEQITNDLQFEEIPGESSETITLRPKVSAVRCAAHTLQLAVNDALKENEELMINVRQAAKALRAPNIATQLRNQNLLQAIIDCATRWDSTADMLERIVSLKFFCQASSDRRIRLSDHAWKNIEDTLNALTCCRVLSKRLQSEQLTFGDFYLSWTQCILETEKLGTPFALLLVLCMRHRETIMFQNESFLAALYMDPRVNFVLEEEQLSTGRNHLALTFQRLLHVNSQSSHSSSQTLQSADYAMPSASTSRDSEDLPIANNEDSNTSVNFSSIESGAMAQSDDNQSVSTKEVDSFLEGIYRIRHPDCETGERTQFDINRHLNDFLKEPLLKSDKNILEYWREKKITDPHLYSLANIVLSTPPTQVSVERLFSSLKFVMNNLRMSLKDKNIDDILVIRNNHLYKK